MCGIWKLVLAASLLFSICHGSIVAAQLAPRIVGGTAVPDARYPFMAAIYYDPNGEGNFLLDCGGSVIGSRWVMTAAHCVIDYETGEQTLASRIAVRVGAFDLSNISQGTLAVAQNIYIHPDYNIQTNVSDIALIELPEAAGTPIISLPLAGSDVPTVDELATVAGWGRNDRDGNRTTNLQEVTVSIVAHSRCLPFYATFPLQLQLDFHLCAGGGVSGGRNVCRGDSGGPLIVKRDGVWVQAGIAVYGPGCARPNIPSVYTRVSSYTDWVAGFVPDLRTRIGGSGMMDNVDVLDESTIVVLSADTPIYTSSLPQGEFAVYEVTGAKRVELLSLSGDADLLIITGTTVGTDGIVCNSQNVNPLDTCDLPSTSERVFAIVYIYDDSTYDITAVRESEFVDKPDIPLVVDPTIIQEPPIVGPPVVDAPPVIEEPLVAQPPVEEPSVVEQPAAAVDSPIIVEASNDDTQLSLIGGSSGGGTWGGGSLLILSALAFARRRYSY